jgi:PPP family 3-phenylpropionic acid transporter
VRILRAARLAPEGGVKALFFSYFALVGAFSPYLALYFESVGLTIAQIGVLMAMPQFMRIFGPPFWGWMADRSRHRVSLLRASAVVSLVVSLGIAAAGGSYGWLLALLALLFFATAAQAPIAEAMALTVSGGDSGRYGGMRLWGSIGFVIAVAVAGPVLDRVGVGRLPWMMAGLISLLLAVTWRLPEPDVVRGRAVSVRRRLREPVIAAFFASCFLMLFAHAALYAFYSLYLDRLGFSKTAIGAVWTLGVLAEIVLFRVQRPLFERFGALPLLSFSMAVTVVRFALIGWDGGWWPVVVVTQLMHAITFGMHHSAVMALLHRWFEPAQQARAQALYTTIGYGIGGSLGGLAASAWWQQAGPPAAFYGAAVAAALGWLAVALCQRFEYAATPDGRAGAGTKEGGAGCAGS